jgi:hypothetical protein
MQKSNSNYSHYPMKTDKDYNDKPGGDAPKKDIFADIEALSKSASEIMPSERILTSLPVRKPRRDEFVRCHADLRVSVNIYPDKVNNITYLVGPDALAAMEDVGGGVRRCMVTLTGNYGGSFFAWEVPVPTDSRVNRWASTAFQGSEEATKGWIRVCADMSAGEYVLHRRVLNDAKVPTWPDEVEDVSDLLRLAYGAGGGGDVIDSPDHEVLKRLRGEL